MPDRLTVATWNVNSIRSRLDHVGRFVAAHGPDVLCLQETRCPDGNFPLAAIRALGYEHIALNGEPRHLAVAVPFAGAALTLHNLYIPAGGDAPDPAVNPRFAAKLAFLDALMPWSAVAGAAGAGVVVGDLNVAPLPDDVWSHRQLLDVVSHTPGETNRLEAVLAAGGWVDAVRAATPPPEKVFTWWSYRAREWQEANRGRRLDHLWVTADLAPAVRRIAVVTETRGWERPSDHVPIVAVLEA